MSYFCPTCQRILYNRRLAKCGFCRARVPEAMRFTAAEVAALEQRTAEIERESRERALVRKVEALQQHGGLDGAAPFISIT